jgi:hypothetical protein
MIPSRIVRSIVLAGTVLALLAAARPVVAQMAGTEGIKQGERFAKAGAASVIALTEARRQIDATLMAYNALVTQPSKDLKGDYKKLLKNTQQAQQKVEAVKPKIDAMGVESVVYFKLWASQVANIGDPDLRKRGEDRIAASQKEYDEILAGLRQGGAEFVPFMKDLTDQINFLGSDLRPEALASLKDNADKLNASGKVLFSHIDAIVNGANTFFAPLRSNP